MKRIEKSEWNSFEKSDTNWVDMCRLLGIISKKPIDQKILLEFRQLADKGKTLKDFGCPQVSKRGGHQDGWGIACLSEDREVYRRSTVKATEDPLYAETVKELGSLVLPPFVLMAHLRRAARLETVKEDYCEPFRRELNDKIIFFSYNGYIAEFGIKNGKIDSQVLFERLLEASATQQLSSSNFKKRMIELKNSFAMEYPKRVSSLTFLLSNGEEMLAHRDSRQCKPYYSLHTTTNETSFVVCSEVLSSVSGNWRLLRNNETVVSSVHKL